MTDTNKAETRTPDYPINLPQTGESALGVVGMLAAAVAAILHFRRRVSRDNMEITKDRAEGKLIEDMNRHAEGLIRERDEARKNERLAWTEANTKAVEVARLTSDNQYLTREVTRLQAVVNELQIKLTEVQNQLATLHRRHSPE